MSGATSGLRIRQDDPAQASLTPTIRGTARRALFWIVVGVVVLLVTLLLYGLSRSPQEGVPLGADNPAPGGAMALAEVLRQQGVDVIETASLDETEAALDGVSGATVLLWDMDVLLDERQHRDLLPMADDLVVLDPTFLELEDLAPGVVQAGGADGTFEADCAVPAVQRAGSVEAAGSAYRLVDAGGATGCLADDDRYSLVQVERDGTTVTVLGLADALTNERIIMAGNAALALNLLGQHETLVWYIPGAGDLADQRPLSIEELTPPWVTPFVVLLFVVALGAVFWRSRRVGPLVVENLPVVVRASETMEGRARLYERSDSRLHALDALRIGAVARLARGCGLPRTASVAEVVDAVAALTGRDRADVAGILIDQNPSTDSELVHLSDQLLRLEAEVTERSRPEWTP